MFYTFAETYRQLKSFLTISAFLLLNGWLFAQQTDSVPRPFVAEHYKASEYFPGFTEYQSPDTGFRNVQNYFPERFDYNLGLNGRSPVFMARHQIGFRTGLHDLDLFGFNARDLRYYRTRTPYTRLFILFGMKKEQNARFIHTQNINRNWNLAVQMNRTRSEGFYNRQNLSHNNLSVTTSYTSRSQRYSLLAGGWLTTIKNDENGGIKSDSLLLANPEINKKLIPVNLATARTHRDSRGFMIRQSIYFGPSSRVKTDSVEHRLLRPWGSLTYSFGGNRNFRSYKDNEPNIGYYDNVYFDTVHTDDLLKYASWNHELAWKSIFKRSHFFRIGIGREDYRIVQFRGTHALAYNWKFYSENIFLEAGNVYRSDKDHQFQWHYNRNVITTGPYAGDIQSSMGIGYKFLRSKKVYASIDNSESRPPLIFDQYYSNHFYWQPALFEPGETTIQIHFSDTKNKIKAGWRSIRISDYIYLDSTCTPVRYNGYDFIRINQFFALKEFRIKHLGFNIDATWQKVNAPMKNFDGQALHLPEWVIRSSVFYTGFWFKKATEVQLGLDLTYLSEYYPDAYMPALGMFYWQDKVKNDSYPLIDFFFSMKIKRARLFFKSEHLNAGLMNTTYYLAPSYPAPDRSFKLGIYWNFYD